jgi:isoquinoline 1-oxidoreductase alpha subunit
MQLLINDQPYEVSDEPGRLLLWVLRDELGLTGTKYGCGLGICGSCTVHLDGVPARACITPLESATGKSVTTIEGLAEILADGTARLHPVQQAFLNLQVPQCSWCMSGQMMAAAALLEQNPEPTQEEITQAMNRNYCRCGCYVRVRKAVEQAAVLLAQGGGA